MEVSFYSKANCISCVMTKKWLDKHDVSYTYLDITDDDEAKRFLIGQGFKEMPVIFVEDSVTCKSVSGYRPDVLKELLLGK